MRQTLRETTNTEVAHRGAREPTLIDFLNTKPPVFKDYAQGEDPQQFLDEIQKRCKALHCSEQQSVEFAGFRLSGPAREWFEMYNQQEWTWEEFSDNLMERFMPEIEKENRMYQFEALRQTPEMTVTEYASKFIRLMRYAPTHVTTERIKIRRFIRGLIQPLYELVAATHFPTLAEAISTAKEIEDRRRANKLERDNKKRVRDFGQPSRFNNQKRKEVSTGYQTVQRPENMYARTAPPKPRRTESVQSTAGYTGNRGTEGQQMRRPIVCYGCGQLG